MGARRIVAKKTKRVSTTPVWQKPGWLTRRLLGGAILFSVLGGFLGLSAWQLLQADSLPIDHVQVKGSFRYLDKQDLYAAIGDLSNNGFFAVDVHGTFGLGGPSFRAARMAEYFAGGYCRARAIGPMEGWSSSESSR